MAFQFQPKAGDSILTELAITLGASKPATAVETPVKKKLTAGKGDANSVKINTATPNLAENNAFTRTMETLFGPGSPVNLTNPAEMFAKNVPVVAQLFDITNTLMNKELTPGEKAIGILAGSAPTPSKPASIVGGLVKNALGIPSLDDIARSILGIDKNEDEKLENSTSTRGKKSTSATNTSTRNAAAETSSSNRSEIDRADRTDGGRSGTNFGDERGRK